MKCRMRGFSAVPEAFVDLTIELEIVTGPLPTCPTGCCDLHRGCKAKDPG
jgi:hypothetical protein